MSRVMLIGGGGFAKEVWEIADLMGHDVVGYVADSATLADLEHFGTTDQLAELRDRFDEVVIAFGAVDRKSLARRTALIKQLEGQGFQFATLISPHAVVSRGVQLGAGIVIAHGVIISVDAVIGNHVILNTSAIVGHDAVISDHSIVAPAAFIGGVAHIGSNCLIGPQSSILQGIRVGDDAIVSVGTTVARRVADGMTILPKISVARK